MKKKIVILVLIIFLTLGCQNKEKSIPIIQDIPEEVIEEEKKKIEYIDNNPIKLGLYLNNNLIKDYEYIEKDFTDIIVLTTFFTNEEYISNPNKYTWKNYYNSYLEDISKYKIGYYISFMADGKKYEKTILNANDTFYFAPYLYIYLYDDINQPDGAFYSHIEENEFNDNTILSSIKIYHVDKPIDSNITLTAFTYDDDDFDKNGLYRGNSKYTVTLTKK